VPATACAKGAAYDIERGCAAWRPAPGVALRIAYRHEMAGFRVIGASFAIDGELVLDTNDPAMLARKQTAVATTTTAPGPHEIGVTLVLAGTGHGIFSYLRQYRFEVRSSLEFTASSERGSTLTVVGYERGGPETPLERRPAARLELE
jgi:hypothetical protein